MSLDPDRKDTAYLLGRLFALLEKVQRDALPGISATIKDRFFGSASARPGTVFPQLIRTSQHHLANLDEGLRIYSEKQIQKIVDGLSRFPGNLTLEQQGLFAIGYYHQKQDLFTKKDSASSTSEN